MIIMDDIIDVDAALTDSFCMPDTDEVIKLLEQWKLNSRQTNNNSTDLDSFNKNTNKYVDTRTFTRSKRKLMNSFGGNANVGSATTASTENEQRPFVNLQIGGLVTSMQRSYLGDVSPPQSIGSMDLSMEKIDYSLITSNDFASINDFINNKDDALQLNTMDLKKNNSHNNNNNDYRFLSNYQQSSLNAIQTQAPAAINTTHNINNYNTSNDSDNCNETFINNSAKNSFHKINMFNRTFDEPPPTPILPLPPHSASDLSNNNNNNNNNKTFFGNDLQQQLNKTNIICSGGGGGGGVGGHGGHESLQLNDRTFNEDTLNGTYDVIKPEDVLTPNNLLNKTFGYTSGDIMDINKTAIINNVDNQLKKQDSIIGIRKIGSLQQSTPHHQRAQITRLSSIGLHFSPITNDDESMNSMEDVLNSINKRKSLMHENDLNDAGGDANKDDNLEDVQEIIINNNVDEKFADDVKDNHNHRNNNDNENEDGADDDDDDDHFIENIVLRNNSEKHQQHIYDIREDERQSLKNFEEFEKSMCILDNDEKEFEDLLNNIAINTSQNQSNIKMRKSLDYIKKKHLQMNLEKQQEELRKKEQFLNNSFAKKNDSNHHQHQQHYNNNNSIDNNKLMDSYDKNNHHISNTLLHTTPPPQSTTMNNNGVVSSMKISPTSSMIGSANSGNGERLLRRSRLYDDITIPSPVAVATAAAVVVVGQHQQSPVNIETLEKTPEKVLENMTDINEKSTISTATENPFKDVEDIDRTNRDRFKTIRLFKKPPENAVMIPNVDANFDDDEDDDNDDDDTEELNMHQLPKQHTIITRTDKYSPVTNSSMATTATTNKSDNQFNKQLTNQNVIHENDDIMQRRRALSRPRYIKGLSMRPQTFTVTSSNIVNEQIKSSSADDLDRDDVIAAVQTHQPKYSSNSSNNNPIKYESHLKSPMGTKSKSITNLVSNNHFGYQSKINTQIKSNTTNNSSSASSSSSSIGMGNRYVQPTLKLLRKSNVDKRPLQYSKLARPSLGFNAPVTSKSAPNIPANNVEPDTFKIPDLPVSVKTKIGTTTAAAATGIGGGGNVRQQLVKRKGLIRPSSGFYSTNLKRNETTQEFERLSPTNSMSSSDSLPGAPSPIVNTQNPQRQQQHPQHQQPHQETNNVVENKPSVTVVQQPQQQQQQPRPSGLRQPSSIPRTSGLPRPLTKR